MPQLDFDPFLLLDSVLLPIALGLIMFGIGLGLRPDDFRRVINGRRAFVIGMGSMLVFVPGVGIALALAFGPTPELTIGLILLATCPSGILSNALTDIAEGDIALSVSISTGLSLTYLVSLPIVLSFLASGDLVSGSGAGPPFGPTMLKIVLFTLVPVSLGMLARALFPSLADRPRTAIKRAATAFLMGLFVLLMLREREVLADAFGTLFALIIAMNVANLVIAFTVSWLGRLRRDERTAITIEHLMRQEGTAIFVAVTLLGSPAMAVPMIVNTLIGMAATAIVIARFCYANRASGSALAGQAR